MKRLILLLTIFLLGVSCKESVPTSKCDEIVYTSIDDNIVEPSDAEAFGVTIISNTYKDGKGVIKFDGDVKVIGEKAFNNSRYLQSIKIPSSVTSIGKGAFSGCENLKEFKGKFASKDGRCLVQGKKIVAFAPAGITRYSIPSSITAIGEEAFRACYYLQSITIPKSVTSIEKGAFSFCGLKSVEIPEGVTFIDEEVFYWCSDLWSVKLPDGLTAIGKKAFAVCEDLRSIDIPYGVTTIGDSAFWSCESLRRVYVPSNVTYVGAYAFSRCFALESFSGVYAVDGGRSLIIDGRLVAVAAEGLRSYTVPDGVKVIGGGAFHSCSDIYRITLPESVTTIEEMAFRSCEFLMEINIPSGVTSIGEEAFDSCRRLKSMTIPESVTTIGQYAFADCTSLESVYCKPSTLTEVGVLIFGQGRPKAKMYVPAESVEAYKSISMLRFYPDLIVGYDFDRGVVVE